MDKLVSMARRLASEREGWTLNGNRVEVPLVGTGRHQSVLIADEEDECVLSSVVLGSAQVTKTPRLWRKFAILAWMRNADHQIITFAFDRHHRLIGVIRHQKAYLDEVELELYIDRLAVECDRFEYLLSGLTAAKEHRLLSACGHRKR
jgi:hypothetical protein